MVNSVTTGDPYLLTNTTGLALDKTRPPKILLPKKLLTSVVKFESVNTTRTGEKNFIKVNTTSDLKWEILGSPSPQEIFHIFDNYVLIVVEDFDDVSLTGRGTLALMEKPKSGYDIYISFLTQTDDNPVYGQNLEDIIGILVEPRTEFRWEVSGCWIEDGYKIPLENELANRFVVQLGPSERPGVEACVIDTSLKYIKMNNITGKIVRTVELQVKEEVDFENFLHFRVKNK